MMNHQPLKDCSVQVTVGVEEHIIERRQVIIVQHKLLRALSAGEELTYFYGKERKKGDITNPTSHDN